MDAAGTGADAPGIDRRTGRTDAGTVAGTGDGMTPYYDDGRGITIYHGDCRDILPTLAAESVDLVLTDPPYGVSNDNRRHRAAHDRGRNRDWQMIHGDDEPFSPSHLMRFRRLVLFGANHYADKLPPSPSWIVWDKRDGAAPDSNADAELAWTNLGGALRMYRQCWRGFARAGSDGQGPHLHPTQKPVALMEWIIDRWTQPGDLILDPYMGSGPIPRACKNLGRRCIAIEIEERYCEIAARRLQQEVLPIAG